MPVVGETKTIGSSYTTVELNSLCESFSNVAKNIRNIDSTELFMSPVEAVLKPASRAALREFYTSKSYDPEDPNFKGNPKAVEDHIQMMTEMFDNDCQAITENTTIAVFNPVVGMMLPMHKFILMNSIFDKGGVPKFVTKTPKWTETVQYPMIVDRNGGKHNLFFEQSKITEIMNQTAPFTEFEVTLPEVGSTNFLDASHLGDPLGHISIASHVSAVKIGDTWYETKIEFKPSYGTTNRTFTETVTVEVEEAINPAPSTGPTTQKVTKTDTLSGIMGENTFMIMSMSSVVTAVKLKLKLDTSDARVKTPSVAWESITDIFEIPEANPINVPISPEVVKDVNALYGANQLNIVMSLIKTILGTYKDDTIKQNLDESYVRLEPWQKTYNKFDFAPREGYSHDHVTWRQSTFMDALDTFVSKLIEAWRDTNVSIGIFGRPDIIRKVTPTTYDYKSPNAIGDITLDYSRTVSNSDGRVYNFMSSQKFNGTNQIIILLNPRNTNRFIYRVYNYQLYVSNEIRNHANPTLPAVHAFERFLFKEYQPVQGRVDILNPTGYRQADTDAWGYHSDGNGVNSNNGYSTYNAANPITGPKSE